MISFLRGTIVEKDAGSIVVDVGGVGYFVLCSSFTVSDVAMPGNTDLVYTYLSLKQDGIDLYGFKTVEEREVFLSLITVSGIGAKSAISILSNMHYKMAALAIERGDSDSFVINKACSKKAAERLVLELKNKKFGFANDVADNSAKVMSSEILNDAISALLSLGLNKKEATTRANDVFNGNEATAEEIVRKVLRNL